VRVELTAAEPVWVSVRSDGRYLFSGVLQANQSRVVDANATVLLQVGNAGGVTILLNGKPIGSVGTRGQVRNLQLTSGGFEIVAPKSPESLEPM
jgi:cytoskeleton protein RodZ